MNIWGKNVVCITKTASIIVFSKPHEDPLLLPNHQKTKCKNQSPGSYVVLQKHCPSCPAKVVLHVLQWLVVWDPESPPTYLPTSHLVPSAGVVSVF